MSSAAPSIPTMSGRFTVWSNACGGAARQRSYRLSKRSLPRLWRKSTFRSIHHACAELGSRNPKSAAHKNIARSDGSGSLLKPRSLKSVTSTRGRKPAAIKHFGQSAIGGHRDLIERAACPREELAKQSVGSGRIIDTQAEPRQVLRD